MLIRTQILLEEVQKIELEELAMLKQVSLSEIVRQGVPLLLEKHRLERKNSGIKSSTESFSAWVDGAVSGPGDSEYDKYAYKD